MKNADLILALLDFLLDKYSRSEEEKKETASHMHKVFESDKEYPENDVLWKELGVDFVEDFGREDLPYRINSKVTSPTPIKTESEIKVTDEIHSSPIKSPEKQTPEQVTTVSKNTPEKIKNQPKVFDNFDFDF